MEGVKAIFSGPSSKVLVLQLVLMGALAGTICAQLPPQRTVNQTTLPHTLADHDRARIPIFYPPVPPLPGAEVDGRAYLVEIAYDAPESLRTYVGEVFYPILGARLAEEDLPRRHRSRLTAYVAEREALLAQLERDLHDARELARTAAAADQLEAEAEALREDLLSEAYRWGAFRSWRVDPALRSADPARAQLREYHVLRAGAFFLPALTIEQRTLLWARAAQGPGDDAAAGQHSDGVRPGGTIAFLPAGASLALPPILTPELHQDLRAFSFRYRQLQDEVVEAVLATDKLEAAEREAVLAGLVESQATKFVSLEAEAERLRVELARQPQPSSFSLPDSLAERADEFLSSRDALRRDLSVHMVGIRRRVLSYKPGAEVIQYAVNFDQGAVLVEPFPAGSHLLISSLALLPEQQERREKAKRAIAEGFKAFAEENKNRETQIAQQARDVLGLIMEYLQEQAKPGQRPESELAVEAARLLAAHDQARRMSKYARYLAATNQPGLSPAQRRLLFGAALRDLNLPLPPGVRRPVGDALDP